MSPEPVVLNFSIPGSHVITIRDKSGVEMPAIMLDWKEATLMVGYFRVPPGGCPVPDAQCLPCGLRRELLAMIALRGPTGEMET